MPGPLAADEHEAARLAMERLRSSYERARAIDNGERVQSFIDSLSHSHAALAREYIGLPFEITLLKIAIRLEEHIASMDERGESRFRLNRAGVAIGTIAAGALAAVAAIREAMRS